MSNIPTGKKIYLCTPDLKPITVLNGIDTESVNYSEHLRDYSSLTFDVYENIVIDGKQTKSNGYDELDVYMNLYLEDIAYFQMQYPQVQNDGIKEYKSITAYSIDKEWEDKDWVNFKVNTGEKDSLEQLVEDNTDDLGFTINFIDFFNPDREDLSLLNIIINEKMPTWSVDASDIDRILWNKKLSISEDSINLYALLTSVIAPNAECIFEFDCLNRKLKAHYKDNLEYDTNIFIGFRNLASQIEQSVDEDSVFTRFNVEGGNNLTIQDWNYNNSRIFNLDYFMHEPYMTQEQIDKFKAWIKWQDENREQFANLSQQVSDYEAKIYTLKYMLPDDGTDIDQWKKMNREGLEESLKYYNSLLDAFEVSVDENPTYTGSDGKTYHRNNEGKIVDEDGVIVQSGVKLTYNPWKIDDQGEQVVDYDRYLQLLYQMENGKSGYYTYYEIVTYIIPNIEIALHNLDVLTEDDEEEYNEDFETNWELYGSVELEGKLEDYENRLEVLKEFAEDDPEYDEEGQRLHEEYIQIVELVGDEETEDSLKWWLKKRRDEIEEIGAQEKPVNLQRMQMVAKVSMYETEILESDENEYAYDVVELDDPNSEWGFTKKDLLLFHILMHDTDYTNESILTTSLNTTSTVTSTETIIQKEKELIDDSLDKLSEISQPQITFSVSMDNIMNIPEFEGLRDDCRLLRFIRLGVRDDYSVKLRIVGRSWNPCEVGDDFSLEFSNMVTSRSGRSDLTDLLNNGGGNASKNSITIGSGNSDSDKEYAANLLSLMVSSGLFGSAVAGVGGTGVDEAAVNELIENYLYSNVINEASFNKIFSRYIDVELLVSDAIKTATISTDQITDSQGNTFADLVNSAINVDTITTNIIQGQDSQGRYYIDLLAGEIAIDRLVSSDGKTAVEFVNGAVSTDIIATNLITGKDGDAGYYMNLLTGHLNMNTIVGNNVFTNAVTSISSTTATSVINDAYIYNAVAGKITVADLAAGDIVLSNNMRILSEEEATEGMIMSGSEIQFLDGDGNPSISIGYNTISDGQGGTTVDYDHPAIIIKDANGSVMLNSTGLSPTDVGLAPMIQNSSISKNQLNFPIIEANAQGGIDITQIYDGSGNLWGVQYTSFVNSTNDALDNLDQKIDDSTVSSLTKEYTISIHYDSLENPDWADSTIPEWQTTEPDKEELGADHYLWERDKITLTDGTVIYSNMVCSRSISGVISEVDRANKSITDKVWQTDIESEIDDYDESVVTSIRNRVSKTETDISGITQTVSDQRETVDALGTRVTTAESNIRQNASNISLMVSVDDETSDITINEKMIQAMTNQFIVKSPDGRRTIISGGLLSTDAIQSNNYIAPTGTASSGTGTYPYSAAGSKFDLTNGNIYTPNFMLDSVNGNAYLSGTIETGAGHIGGFTITDTSIYNNMKSFDDEIDLSNYSLDDNFYLEVPSYYMTEDGEIIDSFELDEDNYIVGVTPVFYGVYIGTDGIALGRGKFKVDSFGNLFANSATITGNITATSLVIEPNATVSGLPALECITQIGSTGVWVTPSGKKPNSSGGVVSGTTTGVKINNDGLEVYKAGDSVAFYGDTARIGKVDGVAFNIKSDSLEAYYMNGTTRTQYFKVTPSGIQYGASLSETVATTTNVADAQAVASSTATNFLVADETGLMVYDGRNNEKTSSTVTVGNVLITSTGMQVRSGTTVLADYGTSIVLGQESRNQFQIDSRGFEMISFPNNVEKEIFSVHPYEEITNWENITLVEYTDDSDVIGDNYSIIVSNVSSSSEPYIELMIDENAERIDTGITCTVNENEGITVTITSEGVDAILSAMRYESYIYIVSTDTTVDTSKDYYQLVDDEYTIVTPSGNENPSIEEWCEQKESDSYYSSSLALNYEVVNSNSVLMNLQGNIIVDSYGHPISITNSSWRSQIEETSTDVKLTNQITGTGVAFGIGSGGYNHGVWSDQLKNWMINTNKEGRVTTRVSTIMRENGTNIYSGYMFKGERLYCFGNNKEITRIATKSTAKTKTGLSFMIGNGYSAVGSTGSINDQSTDMYLCGGTDPSGKYLRSYPSYKRTYSTDYYNMVITALGTIGRQASSSIRYKHDVEYVTNENMSTIDDNKKKSKRVLLKNLSKDGSNDVSSPESILNIPLVYYKYNPGYITGDIDFDYDKPIFGVIADDVASVSPECATYIKDSEGNEIPESYNINQITLKMLYVVQQQEKRITELENIISELQKN